VNQRIWESIKVRVITIYLLPWSNSQGQHQLLNCLVFEGIVLGTVFQFSGASAVVAKLLQHGFVRFTFMGLMTGHLFTSIDGFINAWQNGEVDKAIANGSLIALDFYGIFRLACYTPPKNTTLSDWVGKTGELAKTAPVKIPGNATVKIGTKVGYEQISYKWTSSGYKYEARWHTRTSGAPAGQGNTWVFSRITPGTPTGQIRVEHIFTAKGWVRRFEWQRAIDAYNNGTMTTAQESMLKTGHWSAP